MTSRIITESESGDDVVYHEELTGSPSSKMTTMLTCADNWKNRRKLSFTCRKKELVI